MKYPSLPAALDGILTLVFSFAAFLTILLSLKVYRVSAFMIAFTLAAVFSFTVYRLSRRKRLFLAQKDASAHIRSTIDALNQMNEKCLREVFCSALSSLGKQATPDPSGVAVISGETVVLPVFMPEPVTGNQLKMLLYGREENEKVIILSSAFTIEAKTYAEKRGIRLFSARQIADFLDKANVKVAEEKKRTSIFDGMFSRLFKRTNGLKFILFGLSLTAMAFVVFYPIYYYIAGGAFVIFGLSAMLFSPYEHKALEEKLEDAL